MKSTISELWHGELTPCTDCMKNKPELDNLSILLDKSRKKLLESLPSSSLSAFETFDTLISEYYTELAEAAFKRGFTLATKLFHDQNED